MPSLREWYDKLSAKLHGADEDEVLFETARTEIEEHFDIRRVYKMDSRKISSDAAVKTTEKAGSTAPPPPSSEIS
ncbi:MAG: hypothetical protein WAQ52_08770 [Terriglobales bacterium]